MFFVHSPFLSPNPQKYYEIGYAGIVAVATLFLLIPIQAFFAKWFASLRRFTVEWRDERIRYLSDLLSGISVVKLFAYERPFEDKINSLRDLEMVYIKRASVLRAANQVIFFCSTAFASVVAFVVLWALGRELKANEVS